LVLRRELKHVPATIFVGLTRGCLSELVRAVAIRTGTAVGDSIDHSLVPFPQFSDWSESS
jgi:hypothetical protein